VIGVALAGAAIPPNEIARAAATRRGEERRLKDDAQQGVARREKMREAQRWKERRRGKGKRRAKEKKKQRVV